MTRNISFRKRDRDFAAATFDFRGVVRRTIFQPRALASNTGLHQVTNADALTQRGDSIG